MMRAVSKHDNWRKGRGAQDKFWFSRQFIYQELIVNLSQIQSDKNMKITRRAVIPSSDNTGKKKGSEEEVGWEVSLL